MGYDFPYMTLILLPILFAINFTGLFFVKEYLYHLKLDGYRFAKWVIQYNKWWKFILIIPPLAIVLLYMLAIFYLVILICTFVKFYLCFDKVNEN